MNYQELQEAKETFKLHSIEKERRSLYKERDRFVKQFTRKRILSMTLDEYVVGKESKTSFCYQIERTLYGLGNITGQPASKFGIWYSPRESRYKYDERFGKSVKEAFSRIRESIVELLEDGESHDYESIISNPLNSLIKGKILSVYYPDDYLNIFSLKHINHYLVSLDLDTKELMDSNVVYKRKALVDFKNRDKDMKKWSIDLFALFLWSHYPKEPFDPKDTAVTPKNNEIVFPTITSISFIEQELRINDKSKGSKSYPTTASLDYEKEAKKYKMIGDRGEYVVIQAEISRLVKELSISETKAKKLIKWISRESDTYGYDILSVNKDMSPRYIEVKATQRKPGDADFYYTQNELETAKKQGENYYIYMVYEILTPKPMVWMLKNPFIDGKGVVLKPVKYKVSVYVK